MTRLLIANRGEIARRILRTARLRGYRVAVISTAEDYDSLVRREADEVIEVSSFLDAGAIVAAAKKWRADLLHPGYGFLSESAPFADLVEKASVVFVGPRAETMELLGNKERAKRIAEKSGVPTLGSLSSTELKGGLAKKLAARGIEAPFLVKAAGGGGGRGMRVVHEAENLERALRRASEEAAASFSDPTVFVEKYLPQPRHVEVQVFGDGKGAGVFLGERECSMQRRYQKVIEEAPSPVVDVELRRKLGRAALLLVEQTRYRSAGTVEFLLDEDGSFYFLEVNTRLQVEHPVTEEVHGLDLVDAQFELAEGRWPFESGRASEPARWAVEARVLAEDPRNGFLPTPGPVMRYREPKGPGIRVDSGVAEGGRVPAQYDSMIAKVIASGVSRAEAIGRLSGALETMIVHGPTTNLVFLQAVVRHPDFLAARLSTRWIADHLEELNRSLLPGSLEQRLRTSGFREQLSFALRGDGAAPVDAVAARFRGVGNRVARVGSGLEKRAITIRRSSADGDLVLSGEDLGGEVQAVATPIGPTLMALTVKGETLLLEDPRSLTHRRLHLAGADGEVRAPMAGKVLSIHAREGDTVEEGELLAVVESMKMQLEVHAPLGGRVAKILVEAGEVLDGPDLMAVVAPRGGET